MRRAVLLTCALLLAPAAAHAQAAGEAETQVLDTVQRLWDAMATHDAEAAAALFHPEARMVRTGMRNGEPVVQVNSVSGFMEALRQARGGAAWNEKMYAPLVRVDGNLAMVWTEYTFHMGEEFSHCGVDAIHLVRVAEGWQIIDIADTMRREGCPGGGGR